MLETGRFIVLYISLVVIQVYSYKDPVNVEIPTISRNKNPLVVLIDFTNQIRYFDGESKDIFNSIIKVNEKVKDTQTLSNYNDVESDYDKINKMLFNSDDEDRDIDDVVKNEQTLGETAKEQAKYLFYNFLRTSPDEDSELEDTRHYLRQALRALCIKVQICIKKCKSSKKKCPEKCQRDLDRDDLCEPPKGEYCEKNNCGWGKTMPPKWLL